MIREQWKYCGLICIIEEEQEDDNIKLYHAVYNDARELISSLDISPYGSWNRRVVEQMIDIRIFYRLPGMVCPWSPEEINEMWQYKFCAGGD